MKKKVKYSKKRVPKYDSGGQTPQIDPSTGLPMAGGSQIPFGMIGNLGGGAVDMLGTQDPEAKGYIGTKVGSGALKMAGQGASIGMTVGGPYGAAIGAGAGAILGGVMGGVQANRDRKDAKAEDAAGAFASQQEVYQNRPDFFAFGGMVNPNSIEVEKDELEVDSKNGKILKKFDGQPTHEGGGYQYDAKSGRVIIRGKDAEKFKTSDQFGRMSMVKEHVLSQRNNEEMTEQFRNGGKVNFKSTGDYHKWLGYVHATGLAERTPGNQKVSVRGKRIKVKHFGSGGSTDPNQTNFMQYDENGNPISGNQFFKPQVNPLISQGIPPNIANNFPAMNAIETSDPSLAPYNQNDLSMLADFTNSMKGGAFDPNHQTPAQNDNPTQSGANYKFPSAGYNLDGMPKNNGLVNNYKQPSPNAKTNLAGGVNQAATWAPVAYNTMMAFQKPVKEAPIYNPHETEALNTLRNRKINMDPIRRDIYSQERVASAPLGESQGSYLSRRTQLSANTQKALTDANLKAQDINNGYARDYAGGLDSFGQQRVASNVRARNQDLNVAMNQAQYLPKALEETSAITQGINRDNTLKGMLPDLQRYQSWAAMQKARGNQKPISYEEWSNYQYQGQKD